MPSSILFTRNNYNPITGRCVYTFRNSVPIADAEVGLLSCTFYNSFFNISSAYNNNKFTIQWPHYSQTTPFAFTGYQDEVCEIPDGYYSISDLNYYLQFICIQKGLYMVETSTGKTVYFLTIGVNPNRYLGQIDSYWVPNANQRTTLGWAIPSASTKFPAAGSTAYDMYAPRIVVGQFGALAGFDAGTIPSTVGAPYAAVSGTAWVATPITALSSNPPNINIVSSVTVSCSIVNSITSTPVNMLMVVPITKAYGELVTYEANYPAFTDAVNGEQSDVELSFIDQNGKQLLFFDKDMTFTLQIRPKERTVAEMRRATNA